MCILGKASDCIKACKVTQCKPVPISSVKVVYLKKEFGTTHLTKNVCLRRLKDITEIAKALIRRGCSMCVYWTCVDLSLQPAAVICWQCKCTALEQAVHV